jgi:hypothetical protein
MPERKTHHVGERLPLSVPQEQLDDLRARRRATRWPDAVPESSWDYGPDLSYLQDLCAYWAAGFDWRRAEARLNGCERFVTVVDGERLHYLHAPSPHPAATPLLLTHGWPGSVDEFLGVLGALTDPPDVRRRRCARLHRRRAVDSRLRLVRSASPARSPR